MVWFGLVWFEEFILKGSQIKQTNSQTISFGRNEVVGLDHFIGSTVANRSETVGYGWLFGLVWCGGSL